VSAFSAIHGIVVRDLARSVRQKGRLIGGLARSFMWLILVGAGYNAIARVDGVSSYQAFVYPGIVVMATLFGGMLTAISTVYDREFGILRLMLASPAGVPALLMGRAIAATGIGILQGGAILLCVPLIVTVSAGQIVAAAGVLVLSAAASSVMGLLVAAPLRSVENFASIINIVLFPLLFLSGALYPTARMPAALRAVARVNPVSYAVDLTRAALGQPAEFSLTQSIAVLLGTTLLAFLLAGYVFDPERRFIGRRSPRT